MAEPLTDAATGEEGSNHLDPSMIPKAVKKAVERAGIGKPQVDTLSAIPSPPID